jgi:glycosyltransferase involved in cell wall biosynthesis
LNRVGLVAIGRNEAERLRQCLTSPIAQNVSPVVHVDSGSTDGSAEMARSCGVEVVELDISLPFPAARARKAGFERLRETHPDVAYVQFVDGDCEVIAGWIEAAAQALDEYPDVVAVYCWRQELFLEHSLFNRICDVEWRMGPVGQIANFGGDVMIRADALTSAGGYNLRVIAAEDDELGVRLR